MRTHWCHSCVCVLAVLFLGPASPAPAAGELTLQLPLGRTAYQTNERIDLAVVRSSAGELAAGELAMVVSGEEDGSRLSCWFPAAGGGSRRVEHLHLSGWYLRPGRYTVEVTCDGTAARTQIELYSHVRQSSFRLVDWGRARGKEQLPLGEENLGFNLFYGGYGNDDEANFIRAGMDFMANCVMSGGHQMDLRMECDWSDPYVLRGGTRRVVRRAFIDRTRPNVPGVHFYDEPGLTWHKHPETGEFTPHMIPAQVRSYRSAYDVEPIPYHQVDSKSAEDVRRWKHWARWKLGLMDAAWQDAQFGVGYVRPDFVSLTQSQYGFSAFTDGYYFNVARSLPITSGHGGYHDFGPGYFNPSYFLELARARDFTKPCWYLPTWYGNTTTDHFRLEQYLAFQTNIQGMMSPPDIDPFVPAKKPAAQGVVESNKLMGRLGTVFMTLPVTRPPVAMLFSLSHNLHRQAQDRSFNYAHADDHLANVCFTYLAGKLQQQQFMTVLDEDVIDGTLAASHRVLIVASVDHLDPEVLAGLDAFSKAGGVILATSDCQVRIPGAIDLGMTPAFPDADQVRRLHQAGNYKEAAQYTTLRHYLAAARKLADVLEPHLRKAGIGPIFASSQPGIVATRQAAGDIEYLFAVNATHDAQGSDPRLGLAATTATISIPADGRPVYDAVLGGVAKSFEPRGKDLGASFRFGPGQMRVFARTARAIGGVKLAPPILRRDLAAPVEPIRIDVAATLLDDSGRLLAASVPLRIRLTDPLGVTRYDLYRATDQGILRMSLPLAANDPAGDWILTAEDLLAQTRDSQRFPYAPAAVCAPASGATHRAVFLAQDRQNVFRFFRVHQKVTIVKGPADYDAQAAGRLASILQPWDVRCEIVEAAQVNRPRPLSEEEALTWVGLPYAGKGQIKPGTSNSPAIAGFDVDGPVILIGRPEDHPLVGFLQKERFLPYVPDARSMPGPGRGLFAWQRDAIGPGQESVVLVAYDAEGMREAVGSLYEAAAGIEPLTPLALPARSAVEPAKTARVLPTTPIVWEARLPDRIDAISASADRPGSVQVLSHDGTLATLGSDGRVVSQELIAGPAQSERAGLMQPKIDAKAMADAQARSGPSRIVKFVVPLGGGSAVAFWGGGLEIVSGDGTVQRRTRLDQDVTALASAGGTLLAGLADGRVLAVAVR